MMKRLVLLPLTLAWLFAVTAIAAQSNEEEEKKKGGFTFDVAFGWTATRGNDVQLGDRTSITRDELFEEDMVFDPLVMRMENDYMPIVRAGYGWEKWGIKGEYWQLETGGSIDGSFENSGNGRTEQIRFWDAWQGDFADTTSYSAENDLSLRSIRVDLTRAFSRNVSLAVGLHAAKYEGSRGENLHEEVGFPFELLFFDEIEVTQDTQSHIQGWLYGPSIGFHGSASLGKAARLGYSVSQSLLFGELDQEASWSGRTNFLLLPDAGVETATAERTAVPVTDLRLDLTFDLGDHVSIGGFALVSAWVDVPMAPEYSAHLGQWEAPRSTLVFASFGPVVKVRF